LEFRKGIPVFLAIVASVWVLVPLFSDAPTLGIGARLLIEATLIYAFWRLSRSRPLLVFVISLAVLNEVSEAVAATRPEFWVVVANLAMDFLFVGTIAGFLAVRGWQTHRVNAVTLFAAVAVYFLVGYFWATSYAIVEYVEPGSFQNACALERCVPDQGRFPRLTYFSFVTMTTLGYGDIVPLTGVAQGLTTLTAVVGQLYLALLIGRLVGDYLANRREQQEPKG
jgi:hypothetical protein